MQQFEIGVRDIPCQTGQLLRPTPDFEPPDQSPKGGKSTQQEKGWLLTMQRLEGWLLKFTYGQSGGSIFGVATTYSPLGENGCW